MPTISKKSMDSYRSNLGAIENRSVRGLRKALSSVSQAFMLAPNQASREEFRAYIVDEVYGRIDVSVAQAQALADDVFESITGATPSPHEPFPYEAAMARVRSAAVHLFKDKSKDEFIRVIESYIRKEVKGAANAAMSENAEQANRQ